jgi:hypothetical protein
MFLADWEEEIAQKSQFATNLRIGGDSVYLSRLLFRRPCPTSWFSLRCNFFSLSNQTPRVRITCVYVIVGIKYITRKGNGHPIICLHRHRTEAEVQFLPIRNPILLEMGGQHHFPAALTPGRRRGIQCTGGWVDLGTCLDGMENIASTRIRFPDHPLTTPFRPSYFTHHHHHHHQRCRFRVQVLSYVTHSLSDDPAVSIFFLRILYPFFHGIDAAVLVLVSGCFRSV